MQDKVNVGNVFWCWKGLEFHLFNGNHGIWYFYIVKIVIMWNAKKFQYHPQFPQYLENKCFKFIVVFFWLSFYLQVLHISLLQLMCYFSSNITIQPLNRLPTSVTFTFPSELKYVSIFLLRWNFYFSKSPLVISQKLAFPPMFPICLVLQKKKKNECRWQLLIFEGTSSVITVWYRLLTVSKRRYDQHWHNYAVIDKTCHS